MVPSSPQTETDSADVIAAIDEIHREIDAAIDAKDCERIAELVDKRSTQVTRIVALHQAHPIALAERKRILAEDASLRRRVDILKGDISDELGGIMKQLRGLKEYARFSG